MFVLTMLFVLVTVLLVFSMTKDTGRHTKHARKQHAQLSPPMSLARKPSIQSTRPLA